MHADKHQSFYKLALLFLMEATRHVQCTQNRKLVILLYYLKKKILQLLLCSIAMQNKQLSSMLPVATCSLLGSYGQKWVQPFRSWNSKISFIIYIYVCVCVCIYIYMYIYFCSITFIHKRVLDYHMYRWKEQNNYIVDYVGESKLSVLTYVNLYNIYTYI